MGATLKRTLQPRYAGIFDKNCRRTQVESLGEMGSLFPFKRWPLLLETFGYAVAFLTTPSGPKGLKKMMSWGSSVRAATRAMAMASPVNKPK
jgi:hypothetical protein